MGARLGIPPGAPCAPLLNVEHYRLKVRANLENIGNGEGAGMEAGCVRNTPVGVHSEVSELADNIAAYNALAAAVSRLASAEFELVFSWRGKFGCLWCKQAELLGIEQLCLY